MPDDTDRRLLNEHQRRHFEVVLAMLQNTLTEVEQLAAAAPSNALLDSRAVIPPPPIAEH